MFATYNELDVRRQRLCREKAQAPPYLYFHSEFRFGG